MTLSASKAKPPANRKNIAIYMPLLAYAAFVFVVAIIAYYSFWQIEGVLEREKIRDLDSIAESKVRQISAWRETQKRTGEAFTRGTLLADEFDQWLQDGMPSNVHKHRIQQLLAELQYANGYKAFTLLDRQGVVRASTNNDYDLGAVERQLAAQAMDSRQAVFSDFHRDSYGNKEVRIDLAVPLTITGNKTVRIVGAAVLHIDPKAFLYPLIQSWPTHISSAETLLVRREGNDVVFLNELRHNNNPPLSLRIPLASLSLPAAMGIRGETSAINGLDYRGIPVVAAMRAVPGTPWFMVAKVDKGELFAPIYQLKIWTAGLGLTFTFLGGALFFSWLNGIQTRGNQLKAQRDAALEREMLVKHFEYLTKYASDIILVADTHGKIVEANECAVEAFGYTHEELLRMNISDLRPPTEDTALFNGQLEQINKLGELRYEIINQRKDGTTFPVEVCIRVIEAQGVKYLHGIARDITDRKRAEHLLRQQKNFTLQIIDTVPNLIFVTNTEGKFLLVNQFMANLHHLKPEELVGQIDAELFMNKEQAKQHLEMDREVLETRRKVEFITHNLMDEKSSWLHFTKVPMQQPDGTVNVLSIGVDITERKHAENILRQQKNFTLQVIDTDPNLIFVTDADGKFLLANQATATLHGMRPEELVGQIDAELFMLKEQTGKHLRMNRDVIEHRRKIEFIKRNFLGSNDRWLHFTKVPMEQPDGTVHVLSIGVDITDRKQAEHTLRQQKNFTLQVIDTDPNLIFVTDADGKLLLANEAMAALHGMGPGELVGKASADLFLIKEQAEQHLKMNHEVLENRRKVQFDTHHFMGGKNRWLHFTKVPMEQPDGTAHVLNIGVDITDRKQFEEMRTEMEHINRLNIAGEMASGLAHELSQPLTACNNYLVGCLHRMNDDNWDREKLVKAVQLAQKQAERAGMIINHLKNMVRKQGHEHTLVDVNSLAKDVMNLLEDEIKREGISIRMALLPLPQIMACKVEIEQVLHNLYKNAIESMQACSQRELCLSTRIIENGHILISVSDSGKGISSDKIKDLFSPFQTSKQDGLGLGLVICRSFVENHGGRIWANPQRECGAEFCFTLPTGANHE